MLRNFMTIPSQQGGETVKIFLFWGQSNMNGQGVTADLTGELSKYAGEHSNIRIYGGLTSGTLQNLQSGVNSRSTYAANLDFGLELSFLYTVAEYFNETVYGIKYAPGGVPLEQTVGLDDWNINSTGELFDLLFYNESLNSYVQLALPLIQAENPVKQLSIEGIIGAHGEQDAIQGSTTYQADFSNMLNLIKTTYSLTNVKVIFNRLKDITTYASQGDIDLIKEAQTNVADSNSNYSMTIADDLIFKGDQIHFTSESSITLGIRNANAYLNLL